MKPTPPHLNRFALAPVALLERELQPMLEARARIVLRADFIDEIMELEHEEPELEIVNGVGIIHINGCLGMGLAEWEKKYLGMTDVDDVSALLAQAVASNDVRAILFGINSPGGSVCGIPELAARVFQARQVKPVFAWTRSVCASAAYWIASQASAVYASTSAILGSIGVYTVLYDTSKMYENAGYKVHLVKAGANKAIGVAGIPVTEDQLAIIQERVDTMYAMFTGAVLAGRGAGVDKASFDGADWFAAAALNRGLIDEIHNDGDAVMNQISQLVR
jgi:signal peptide peptidase SppA